jgi:predicted nicotinamide N-methyase
MSRRVTVRGKEVEVLQDMSTTAAGLGGAIVWDAALVLAHYFESDDFPGRDHFSGMRTLELGAGCGLPSLVAAALGERALESLRAPNLRQRPLHDASNQLSTSATIPRSWGKCDDL